jgi:hypothetical protein
MTREQQLCKASKAISTEPQEFREPVRAKLQVHLQKTSINKAIKDLHAEIRRIDESIHPALESYQKLG